MAYSPVPAFDHQPSPSFDTHPPRYNAHPDPLRPALPMASSPMASSTPRDTDAFIHPGQQPATPKPAQNFLHVVPPLQAYIPIPLRRWYAFSLALFMVAVAIGIEVALHFSQKREGWHVKNGADYSKGILHYVYTLPPVAVAMIIVALAAWTDVEIKRLQPYIDLAYGNAPAETTLLLDYTTTHPALVSLRAVKHNHYVVALSSLGVLSALAVQPLAASLFTVKQVWWPAPDVSISTFSTPALNPNFGSLDAFTAAAGLIEAKVMFNASPPSFTDGVWTVAPVTLPRNQIAAGNGTLFVSTTSVRSTGNCLPGENGSINQGSTGNTFTITGNSPQLNCTFSTTTPPSTSPVSGVLPANCSGQTGAPQFGPVGFYTVDPTSSPVSFSLTFCDPRIQVLNANAQIAVATGALTNATIASNLTQTNNITDPNGQMHGRAFNGVGFDVSNADTATQQRALAAPSTLSRAMLLAIQALPGGLGGQTRAFNLTSTIQPLYELYLSAFASRVYFVTSATDATPLVAGVKTFQPRLQVVAATTHILAALLVLFAALTLVIHAWHAQIRDPVVLPTSARPGTLASAAALTPGLGRYVNQGTDEHDLRKRLEGKRFRFDPRTGRIIMEGAEDDDKSLTDDDVVQSLRR